jgi:coproporphyrinogen III oxidase
MKRIINPAAIIVILLCVSPRSFGGSPGDHADQLTPEQATVAKQMLEFMPAMEQEFWTAVDKLNGRATAESQLFDPDSAHYEVRTKRGKVIEKAGVMSAITKIEKPPFVNGAVWNRFFEVAVHPATPRVGMLHATFVVQVGSNGQSTIAGTLDQMKAGQPPEDLQYLDTKITEVFAKHGMDREKFRVKGCGKPNEGGWKWHRPSTCSGASIFGAELTVNDKNYAFVSEVFQTGVRAYFDILRKRYRERPSAEDYAAQDFMRRRWLEDQLFWDVLSKNFVPYEAWSAVNAPPVVKY